MKVKNVIISALRLLGESERASLLEAGENEENDGVIATLLYCFNSVEDELARRYVPLNECDELKVTSGKIFYTVFKCPPVRIKRVLVGGEPVKFEVFPLYMRVNAEKVTVEYEYSPRKKSLDGTSDYDAEVGEYLLALGMAAEYCLINGEIEASEQWEKKYRNEIDGAQKRIPVCRSIPPRRWV